MAKAHPGASYTQTDCAESDQVRRLMADMLSFHGRLNILVNNAGMSAAIPHDSWKEASAKIWRSLNPDSEEK